MKLALVTGGTRRLGAHIAARLAAGGYALALHGRHETDAEPWLGRRLAECGVAHHGFYADLSDADQVEALVPAVAEHFGAPVTLLVNNASLFAEDEPERPDIAALESHFRINVAAPYRLALAVSQGAADTAVVNILDQRIRNPHGAQPAYSMSKQALGEATRLLAAQLAPRTRVNGVAPGLTMPSDGYDADQVERLRRMMPLERLSSPEDVADAVAFLAEAQAVTGQIMFVDGGASMTAFDRDFVDLAR